MILHMGLDIGSTTVKLVVIDSEFNILYSTYRRHYSNVFSTVREVINESYSKFKYDSVTFLVTGSGGIGIHDILGIDFIQEVVAGSIAIENLIPDTDVAIELGGEDSKITYLKGSIEQRMNSICAGGTGAFIDQMATLLETDALGLNNLSKDFKKIYPIASRCGVFAKTDVQALINQGASKSDIAASVFQSVVNQTISNLACGRPIRGKIAFLGGPLHFLPMLKERFINTLNLRDDEIISPTNSQIFVAMGAAISSIDKTPIPFVKIYNLANKNEEKIRVSSQRLNPLFKDEEDFKKFKERHENDGSIKKIDLKTYKGPMYIGIDSGSTTTKLVVLSKNDEILYSFYGSNKGKPLDVVIEELKKIYKLKNDEAYFAGSGATGYGEEFLKAALNLDHGEVETIAHFRGAKFYNPNVDFIIDIGGQDMKSMRIKDGVIDSILLNEACSSGCGSFLESFASTVNLSASEFSNKAIDAKSPVDLGSRCTVFMNSNVKQAQKEGASVNDIAAGLSLSVIKNAIQKVIKIRDPQDLGENIVVQGGTFLSDAVLRSFEIITGREVIRPKIAGLMGAFGMALIAKEKSLGNSTIIDEDSLYKFSYKSTSTNCNLCSNNCALSVNIFSNNKKYITGNRCERGLGIKLDNENLLPNLYKYKLDRVFNYKPLEVHEAKRGIVGIPRVLNIYENYPFWHTFFTDLGYRVELSDKSTRQIYELGIDSITSETACYPAKIVHGHIENLIKKGIKFIFYPSIFYENREFEEADNNLNCPVVCGYSEVIKNNVENLKIKNVKFSNPFLSLEDEKKLGTRLNEIFISIPKKEIDRALRKAYEELNRYKKDIRDEGKRAIDEINRRGLKAVVLAGRPYHVDNEINHGISELITSLGVAVLSEDSVSYNIKLDKKLRILDQWSYHSRLYRAAKFVCDNDNFEMIQLNSFGCGIDAVTTDQVNEILQSHNKIYTVIKIDEVNNLGAIKIRIRSLLEASQKKEKLPMKNIIEDTPIIFTKQKKDKHTLLLPQMAPIHFELFKEVLNDMGFKTEVLEDLDTNVVNEGLKYVNNDACYPSIFVVGQFIDALKSGKYDLDNTTLLITQTGGACRASNYVGFIRKALKDSGYGNVGVLPLSFQGIETHEGFSFTKRETIHLIKNLIISMLFGDLIMRLTLRIRPYEKIKGSVNLLKEKWIQRCKEEKNISKKRFREVVRQMIYEYNTIEISNDEKVKVGIVGEILVKYLPAANNYLVEELEKEGAEAVVPDLTDFMMYSFKNAQIKYKELSKNMLPSIICNFGIKYIEWYRDIIRVELKKAGFEPPKKIEDIMDYAKRYVDLGNQYGEGWLLTGEIVELIHMGVENVVCVQPFGCLPNHITGKGVIKAIRETYENANIVPIDYDASASKVNQINRIKLMLSQGSKNLKKKYKLKRVSANKTK